MGSNSVSIVEMTILSIMGTAYLAGVVYMIVLWVVERKNKK